MEQIAATESASAWALPHRLSARLDPPAIGAWTLAFALVAYLALNNGGYDTIVRSQVGIAIWWIVLLGALAGVLPARVGAGGWVAIGLLAAFAAWTGLSIGWSESAERSAIEAGRVAMYLGALVLAIALQGRSAARHTINGIACAIGLVALLAILSRLHPQWFPINDHATFFDDRTAAKLSYPLNYWNALAAFAAMGVPLLLAASLGARTLAGQALAAAALPVCALCLYLTVSRGGALALAVGIVAFAILAPRRLEAIATLLVAAAGSAILVSAASQRDALEAGEATASALSQGDELLWLVMIACCGVALLRVAIGLVVRYVERPPVLAIGRRTTALGGAAILAAVVVVAIAAGAPGAIGDRWQEFKAPLSAVAPSPDNDVFSRLQAAGGNGRYQLWRGALSAFSDDPLKGIGPGTFEYWWSRNGNTPIFVRDAHSLYLETLGETGIVGFALLAGFLLWMLGAGFVRSLRVPDALRLWIAAATAGLAAFMTAAAVDWVWEMASLAVAAVVLGAVIVAGRENGVSEGSTRVALPARGVLVALSVAAFAALTVPLAGALATDDSRAAAADGRLQTALDKSATAQRLQPYAATPLLQRAVLLEEVGAYAAAASAARAATVQEPTNWRGWIVLARVEGRRDHAAAAVRALRTARSLNPLSPLLAPR